MRSPLRYPGGKTRACSTIVPLLNKQGATRLVSPFVGGASVELAWLGDNPHGTVDGFDLYEPLAVFWKYARTAPDRLADVASMHMPLDKHAFRLLKDWLDELEGIDKAAAFFVLNRCSFSGATNSGGMSPGHPRFNQRCLDRLRSFKADWFRVDHYDGLKLLSELSEVSPDGEVLYLDPPYDISNPKLYGRNGSTHHSFDHTQFAQLCRVLNDGGWRFIISYDGGQRSRDRFEGFEIREASWSYGMRQGSSSECLILSDTFADAC